MGRARDIYGPHVMGVLFGARSMERCSCTRDCSYESVACGVVFHGCTLHDNSYEIVCRWRTGVAKYHDSDYVQRL